MLITGVLCGSAAIVCAVLGLWSLLRPAGDVVAVSMRAVAPTQLAAAVMLAAGAAVALAAPRPLAGALVSLCVVGAVGTIAAGCWQSARYSLRGVENGCGGDCVTCPMLGCTADSVAADVDRVSSQ